MLDVSRTAQDLPALNWCVLERQDQLKHLGREKPSELPAACGREGGQVGREGQRDSVQVEKCDLDSP